MEGESTKESQTQKIPLSDGLRILRNQVESYYEKFGGVVVLIEGAWGTGKTTLATILSGGIGRIPPEKIKMIDIDQETIPIFGAGGDPTRKTLYEQARSASGKNLIEALYLDEQKPAVLIIDAESSKRVLIDEIGIWRGNVIVVNLCPDSQSRWNNLYNRGYPVKKIVQVINESPTKIDPDALNIDNSLPYRLPPEEMENILRGPNK